MSEQHMVVAPIDETLWQQYLDSLGDDDGSVILLDEEDSDDDDEDDDASSGQKSKAECKKKEKEKPKEEVVVLSSDSESEEDPFWSNSRKARDFKQLWERARFIIFHKLMSSSFLRPDDEPMFPYQKLQDLADALKDFQKKNHLSNDELDFLWRNVLQWLLAIKLSSDPLDLTYDQKFNYILVDFMVQFINVENKLNLLLDNERLVADAVGKMMQVLSIVFNGNNLLILKTLLRIDLRAEYSEMLDPVFNLLMLNSSKKLKKAVERNFILYKRFINRQRATQALNQNEERRAALVLNRQPADPEERVQNPGSRLSLNTPHFSAEGRRKLGNRAVPRRRLEILGGINSHGNYSIEKPTDRFKINLECLDCIELDSTDDESESLHNNRNLADDKDSTQNSNSNSNPMHEALDKENIVPDQQNIQSVVDKEKDEDIEKDSTAGAMNLSANFYQTKDTKPSYSEQTDLMKNEIEPAPDAAMETTEVEVKPEESETLVKTEQNAGVTLETKADDDSNSDITAINSRVEKLCIPGEVSSTTCMDHAVDAAKAIVINPNEIAEGTPPLPSALKVLSPETCQVGSEVRPLKQQMSPCQSDAVTGNYKPTSWNVINEATSTTEVSQKAQSAESSPATAVPKPTETTTETERSCSALDDSKSSATIQNSVDDVPNSQSSTTIQTGEVPANSQSCATILKDDVPGDSQSSTAVQNSLDDLPGDSQFGMTNQKVLVDTPANSQSSATIQNLLDDIPTCSKYVKQKPLRDPPLPIWASRGQYITEPLDREKDTLQDTGKPTSIPISETESVSFPIYEDISMESIDSEIKTPIENDQGASTVHPAANHWMEEESAKTTKQQNFVGASWQNIACLQSRGQHTEIASRSHSDVSRKQQSDDCFQEQKMSEESSGAFFQKKTISEESSDECVIKEHDALKSFSDRETMEAAETERLLKEVEEHLAKIEVKNVEFNLERSDIEDPPPKCISAIEDNAVLSSDEDVCTEFSKSHGDSIFLNEKLENPNSEIQTSTAEEIPLEEENIIPNLEMGAIDEIETKLHEEVAIEAALDVQFQEKEIFLDTDTNQKLSEEANENFCENTEDSEKVTKKEDLAGLRPGSFDADQESEQVETHLVDGQSEKVNENVIDLNLLKNEADMNESQSEETTAMASKHRHERELENVDQNKVEIVDIDTTTQLNSIQAASSAISEIKLGESASAPSDDSLDAHVISHLTEEKINEIDLDIRFMKAEEGIPENIDSELINNVAELQSCTSDIIEMQVENKDSRPEENGEGVLHELTIEMEDENVVADAEVIQTVNEASAKKSELQETNFNDLKARLPDEQSSFLDHIYVKEGNAELHVDVVPKESKTLAVNSLSEQETAQLLGSPRHGTNLEEVHIFADMSDVTETSSQRHEIMPAFHMSSVDVDTSFDQIENMPELDVIQHEEVATHPIFYESVHLEEVNNSPEVTPRSSEKVLDENLADPNEDAEIISSVSISIESPDKTDYSPGLKTNDLNTAVSSEELQNVSYTASTDGEIKLANSVIKGACNLDMDKKNQCFELTSGVCEDIPENIFDLEQEKSQIMEEILSGAAVNQEIGQNESSIIIGENLSFTEGIQVDEVLHLSDHAGMVTEMPSSVTENDYANDSANILTLNFTLPENMNREESNSFIFDIDMQSAAMELELEELLSKMNPPLEDNGVVSTNDNNSAGINSRFGAEHALYPKYPSFQTQRYEEEHTPRESYVVENLSDNSDDKRTSDVMESSQAITPEVLTGNNVAENAHESGECLTTTDLIQDAVYENCPLSGSQITEDQHVLFQTLQLRSILGDAINKLDENKNSSGYAYETYKQEDDPLFLNHAEVLKSASESRLLSRQAPPTNRKAQEKIGSEPGEQKVFGSQIFPESVHAPLAVPELKLSIELGRIRTPGAKKVYDENQVNSMQLAVAEKIKDEFKVPKVSLRLPTDTLKAAFKQTAKFITKTREDWDYLNISAARKKPRSKSKRGKVEAKEEEENNLFGPIELENAKREAVNTHDTLQCLQKVEEAIRTFEESQVNEEKQPDETEKRSRSPITVVTDNTESVYSKLFPETHSVDFIIAEPDNTESNCHKLLASDSETHSRNQVEEVEPTAVLEPTAVHEPAAVQEPTAVPEPTAVNETQEITQIAYQIQNTELLSKPSAAPKGRTRKKAKASTRKRKVEEPVLQNPFVKLKRLKLLDIQNYDQADKAQTNPPNSLINFENFYVTELQKNQKVRIRKPSEFILAEDDKNMTAKGSKKRATPSTRKKTRGRTSKKEQESILETVNNLINNTADSDIGRNLDNIILALPKNILNDDDDLVDDQEDLDGISISNSVQTGKCVDLNFNKTIDVEEEGDSETSKDEEDPTQKSEDAKNKEKSDKDDSQNGRGGESNNHEHGDPNEDKEPNYAADEEPHKGDYKETSNIKSNNTQNQYDNEAGATEEKGKMYIEALKSDKVCESSQVSTINKEIGKKDLKRKADKAEESLESTKFAKTENKNKTVKCKESSDSNQTVNEKVTVKRNSIPKHYDRTDIFDDYESDESMDIEATQSVIAELKLLSPENYVREQKKVEEKREQVSLLEQANEGPSKEQKELPQQLTEPYTGKQQLYSWDDTQYKEKIKLEQPAEKEVHFNEMKVHSSTITTEPIKTEKPKFKNELMTESKELSQLHGDELEKTIEPEILFEKLKDLQDVKLIDPSTFCGTLSGQKLTFNLGMVLNSLQEERKKGGYWDYKDIKTHWGIEIETGTYHNLKEMHFTLPAALFDGDEDIEEHKFEPPLIKTDTDGLEEKSKPKIVEPVELAYLGTPSHSVELIEENSQELQEKEEDSKSIEVSSLEEPEPLSEIEPLDIPIQFQNEISYPDLLDNIFDKVQGTNDCLISGRDSHDNKPILDPPESFVSPTPVNEGIDEYKLTLDGLVNSFTSEKLFGDISKTEISNVSDCPADCGFPPVAPNTSAPIDHDYNLDVNSLNTKNIEAAMPVLPLTPDMSPTGTFKFPPKEGTPSLQVEHTPIDFSVLAALDLLSPSTLTNCHDEGLILTQFQSVMEQISDLYRATLPPQYNMVPPAVINNHSVNAENFPISQSVQQPPQFPPISTALTSDDFLLNDPQPPAASLELFDIVPITPPQPAHTFINHNSSSNIQTPPYPDISAYENCPVHNMQNLELDSCDANFEFSSKRASPEPSTPTPPPEKKPKLSTEPIKPMTSNEIFDMLKHEKPLNEVVPKPDQQRRNSILQSTSKSEVKPALLEPAKAASFQEVFSRLVADEKRLANSNSETATKTPSTRNSVDVSSKPKTESNKDAKKSSSARRQSGHTKEKNNQESSSAKQRKRDKYAHDAITDNKQKDRHAEKRDGYDAKPAQRASSDKSKQKSSSSSATEKSAQKSSSSTVTEKNAQKNSSSTATEKIAQKSSRSAKTVSSEAPKEAKSRKTDAKSAPERESRLKATKTNQPPKEKPADPPISLPGSSQTKSRQNSSARNRKQTTPSNVAPVEPSAPIEKPPSTSSRSKKKPRSPKSTKETQQPAKSPPKEQPKHSRTRKEPPKEETQAPKQHFSIINELKKTTATGSIQAVPETAYQLTASSMPRKRNASPVATQSKKSKTSSETSEKNGRKRKQCAQPESESNDPKISSHTQKDTVKKTRNDPKQKNHKIESSLQNHTDDIPQKPLRQSKRGSSHAQQQPQNPTHLQLKDQYSNIPQGNTDEFQEPRATDPYAQQSLFPNTEGYAYQSEPLQDQSRTEPHTNKPQRTRPKYVNKYSELGRKPTKQNSKSAETRSRSVESNMDTYSVASPVWPGGGLTVTTPWVPSQPTLYQIIDTLQGKIQDTAPTPPT